MSKNPEEDMEPFLDEERERENRLRAALCLDLKLKFWLYLDALPRSVDRGGVVYVSVRDKVVWPALVLPHTGLLQPRPS